MIQRFLCFRVRWWPKVLEQGLGQEDNVKTGEMRWDDSSAERDSEILETAKTPERNSR